MYAPGRRRKCARVICNRPAGASVRLMNARTRVNKILLSKVMFYFISHEQEQENRGVCEKFKAQLQTIGTSLAEG